MVFSTLTSVVIGLSCLLGGFPASDASPAQRQTASEWNVNERDVFGNGLSSLENITPSAPPKSIDQVMSRLKLIKETSNPQGYYQTAAELISHGITTNDLHALTANFSKINNPHNINKREPKTHIYPKKSKHDAPYSKPEAEMRAQIFIPKSFTYGKKPPVILVPGTGTRGGNNFVGNFIKTLDGKPYADIVWLNPPGYQLADAQENAETVAYAINYVSGISRGRNVSMLGWSQGSISMQWALKYWPSTRKLVSNVVAYSGDYHGTLAANLIDPAASLPYPPAILQQKYNSNFIKALRSNGGDSAYVPTTSIYSSFFDEIVEPQQGRGASAYLDDARGVGVSNNDIQKTCPRLSPAAALVTHESNLFNPLTQALTEQVLKHGSPGRPHKLDLTSICNRVAAPELDLQDILLTEATIPFAVAMTFFLYPHRVFKEPPLKHYAL